MRVILLKPAEQTPASILLLMELTVKTTLLSKIIILC